MMSPMAKNSSAVYRMDNYGQYRDMLEQRQYGKFYITSEDNSSTVDNSPIQVRFVDSYDGMTLISPYATDSTNFSLEYTSSLPYVDSDSQALTRWWVLTVPGSMGAGTMPGATLPPGTAVITPGAPPFVGPTPVLGSMATPTSFAPGGP
jgi:hypothetical protein